MSFFSDTAQAATTYSILMVEVGPNVEGVVTGLTDLGCPEASARVFVQAAAAGSRPEIMYDVPSDEALTVATALRNQGAIIEVRPENTTKNGASPTPESTAPASPVSAPPPATAETPAPVTAAVPVVPPVAPVGPSDFPGPPQIPTLPTPAAPPVAGPSPLAPSPATAPPAAPIAPPPAPAPSYSAPPISSPPVSPPAASEPPANSAAPPANSAAPLGHSALTTASSPAAVVQAYLDAYNAGDSDAVRKAFAPDAVFDDTHGSVLAQGQDAIGALFASLVERVPGRRVTVANRLTYQGWVVDHQVADTPGQAPQSTVAAYLVHDGLIRRAHLLRE